MLFGFWNHSISLSSRDSRLSCDCVSLSLPPTGPAPMPAPQDQCALAPQAGHRHSARAEKVRQPQAPRRQAHAAQRAAAREEPAPRPPFSFPRWTTNKNRGVPNFAQLFWLRARLQLLQLAFLGSMQSCGDETSDLRGRARVAHVVMCSKHTRWSLKDAWAGVSSMD